jgi:nucleoside-diphosphate-sugar epimerase
MPAIPSSSKVLVTGASGFIAAWVVRTLLERSFSVVGTVRSTSKGEYLKKLFAHHKDKFSYAIVPDMGKDDAFDGVVGDVDAVIHTASPFSWTVDDPADIIDPAVNGTVNILKSVAKNGHSVKRVVVTSSFVAIYEPREKPIIYTEADWNTYDTRVVEELGRKASGTNKYYASKTLAERAAWAFVEKNKDTISFDLSTINPPWVFGPFIHDVPTLENLNESNAFLRGNLLLNNTSPEALAAPQGSWVDVRDAALAHVVALEREAAGGERFLAAGGAFSFQEMLDALHQAPDLAPSVTKGVPGAGPMPSHEQVYGSGEKTTRVLGIKFRSLEECVKDVVKSLRERGWSE